MRERIAAIFVIVCLACIVQGLLGQGAAQECKVSRSMPWFWQTECLQWQAACTPPCGEVGGGECWTDGHNMFGPSCKCYQEGAALPGRYVNASGWNVVDADPAGPPAVGTFVFTFVPEQQADEMHFVILNDDGITEIDRIVSGFSGTLAITLVDEDEEHLYGMVVSFGLHFESYSLCGVPTGPNYWQLDPQGPVGVTYRFDEQTLETDAPLVLRVSNDIQDQDSGWTNISIHWSDELPDSGALVVTGEANGVPPDIPSGAVHGSWGTVKALYR